MKCLICEQEIIQNKRGRRRKYCSNRCVNLALLKKYREKNRPSSLSSATSGAISEYRVCVDLLKQGHDVFRAVSPACSCDLVILNNNHPLRIEVRTSKYSTSGKPYIYPNKLVRAEVIAFVLPDQIIYEPPLSA